MIIMHTTEGGSALSTIQYLNTTKDKDASYHYIIERNGTIYRMCDPNLVAYHAGDSAWPNPIPATPTNQKSNGGHSVNAISIGIAWANLTPEKLTDAQMESALWLVPLFMAMHNIDAEFVRGHYEVSPGRKTDPKPAMEMDEFRDQLRECSR